MTKSTVAEIRERFDKDVERFSNLETGQSATIDSPLCMALIAQAAAAMTPAAKDLLDVGCGAGNYTLRMLDELRGLNVTLMDLSRPMLDRAQQRVGAATQGKVATVQGDVRDIELGAESLDVIVAASVLHHLRGEEEWRAVFAQFHRALRKGGAVWIFDLIEHTTPGIQSLMWQRYGAYLTGLKDEAYRDAVYAYVAKEDTPRPLMFQIDLLRDVGFGSIEILHKTSVFAAFGGMKI